MKKTLNHRHWVDEHQDEELSLLLIIAQKEQDEINYKQEQEQEREQLEIAWQKVVDELEQELERIDEAQRRDPYHQDPSIDFEHVVSVSMLHWEALKILREVQGAYFLAKAMGPHDPIMYRVLTGVELEEAA